MGFSKALPAYYSRAPLKARLKYSAGPRHQHSQPWLWKILIQHGQKQLQAALPPETFVPSPQSNTALFAYVLLTRCLRSWTVLAPCGISWLTGCWRSRWTPSGSPGAEGSEMHTHTTCLLIHCWLNLAILCCRAPKHIKPPTLPQPSIWAASQQKLQNNILQFSAETGSTRNTAVKCWITWTYAGNWKNTWNNSRISLKGWFASLIKLL